ncbi:hypothetical protein [Massilia consociata]
MLLQAYVLLFVIAELILIGSVGFPSGLAYGASLPLSLPSYSLFWVVAQIIRAGFPMKRLHVAYFGSHLLILFCLFAFPGKFGPS